MPQPHPLERRATLLAGALTNRIGTMTQSLTAAQGRIPFNTKMPKSQALDWWAQHRYDGLGQQALARLDPLAIANLDTALTQYSQQKQALGLPIESAASTDQGQGQDATAAMAPGGGQDVGSIGLG